MHFLLLLLVTLPCSLCALNDSLCMDPTVKRALSSVRDLPDDFFPDVKVLLQQSETALEPYWSNASLNAQCYYSHQLCRFDFYQTTIPLQKASARSQALAPAGTDMAPEEALAC